MKNDFITQLQTVVDQIKKAKDELANLKKIQADGTKSSKSVLEKARDDAKALAAEILRLGKLEKDILQKLEKSTLGKNPEISKIIKSNLESGQKIIDQAMLGLSKDVGKLRGSYVGETIFFFHKQIQWYLSKAVSLTLLEIPQVAIQSISDFNKGITELAVLTRALPHSLSETRDVILQVTDSTVYSIKDITSTMKFLAQAGFEIKDINNSMGAIANLATATSSSLQDAASSISTVIVALGMSTSESSKVADILAQATNLSRLSVEDLSTSFNYTAATAGQLGIPISNLTAQLALLSNSGIKASTAATGWRQVMETLIAPSEKAKLIFAKYGITLDSINPKIVKMTDILQNLSKISAPDLSAIFSTRGGNVITALLNQGVVALDMMEVAINKQGIAAQMAAEQMLTLENTWKNLKGSFSSLFALGGVGSNLELINFLTGLAEIIKSFRKENLETIQNTMSSLVKLTSILIPMAVGGKIASLGFNKLLNSFNSISAFVSGGLESHFLNLAQNAAELGRKTNSVKFTKLASEVGGLSKKFYTTSNIISKMGIALSGLTKIIGPVGIATTMLSGIIGVFLLLSKKHAENIGKLKNDLVEYQSEVAKTKEEYTKFNIEAASLKNQIESTSNAVTKAILERQHQEVIKKQQEAAINLLKELTGSNLQVLKEAFEKINNATNSNLGSFESIVKVTLDNNSLDAVIKEIGENLLDTNFYLEFGNPVAYDSLKQFEGGYISTDADSIRGEIKTLRDKKVKSLNAAKTSDEVANIEKDFNAKLSSLRDKYVKLNKYGYSDKELEKINEFFRKLFSYAASSFNNHKTYVATRIDEINNITENLSKNTPIIPNINTVMPGVNLLKIIDDLGKRKKTLEEFTKKSDNGALINKAEKEISTIDEFFNNVLNGNITPEKSDVILEDIQIDNRNKAIAELKKANNNNKLNELGINPDKLASYNEAQLKIFIDRATDQDIKNNLQKVFEGLAASIDNTTKKAKEFGKEQAKLVNNLDVVTYFDKINSLKNEKPFHAIVEDFKNDKNKLQAFADTLGISIKKVKELVYISKKLKNNFDLNIYKKIDEFTKSKNSSNFANIIKFSENLTKGDNIGSVTEQDIKDYLKNELSKISDNFSNKKDPIEVLKERFLKETQLNSFGINVEDWDTIEKQLKEKLKKSNNNNEKTVLGEFLKWFTFTESEIDKLNEIKSASADVLKAQIESIENLTSSGEVPLAVKLREIEAISALEEKKLKGTENEEDKIKLIKAQTEEKKNQVKLEEYQLILHKKFKDMWKNLNPSSVKKEALLQLEELLKNAGTPGFSVDKYALTSIVRQLKSQGFDVSNIFNKFIGDTNYIDNKQVKSNLQEANSIAEEAVKGSSFFHGISSGYDTFKSKVEEGADTLINISKLSGDVLENITDGITNSMALAITEGQALEKSLKSVFSNILKMITQALLKMMIMKTIEAGMKSFNKETKATPSSSATSSSATSSSATSSSAISPGNNGTQQVVDTPIIKTIGTGHTGGIVGAEKMLKAVNLSVFNNAPRYHTGGLVQGEVPIIAKKGEYILTPEQMKAVSSNTPSINFNIVNQSQQPVSVKSSNISINDQKEYIINVLLEDLDNKGLVAQALDRRGR